MKQDTIRELMKIGFVVAIFLILISLIVMTSTGYKQHCDDVKNVCDRKSGCECKLICNDDGTTGEDTKCKSFCCKNKCKCHPNQCP
jgi:hypothetical protein